MNIIQEYFKIIVKINNYLTFQTIFADIQSVILIAAYSFKDIYMQLRFLIILLSIMTEI